MGDVVERFSQVVDEGHDDICVIVGTSAMDGYGGLVREAHVFADGAAYDDG
jgi:hypothetical protein